LYLVLQQPHKKVEKLEDYTIFQHTFPPQVRELVWITGTGVQQKLDY
jgi:hypothetical protein